jgi:alpha-1,2-mannosyltransferase
MVKHLAHVHTRTISVAAIVIWLTAAGYMLFFAARWQLDLQVYRGAGHLLYAGVNPFDTRFTAARLPFTYPPFALMILSPFSFGPIGVVETIWWLLSAAALVTTLYLFLEAERRGTARVRAEHDENVAHWRSFAIAAALGGIACLALEPLRSNIDYGQVNFGLMLLVAFVATRPESRWRGTLIGVAAAVRLTPIVYLAIFAFRRDWRSLLRGVGTLSAATLVGWVVLPSESSLYWFHEAGNSGRTGGVTSRSNQSWYGLLNRQPFHGSFWGWAVLGALTVGCGLFVAKRSSARGRISETIMALALTELLVSPVSWSHHWSWVAIAPIVVVSLWKRHRMVAWALIVILAIAALEPYWWFYPRGVVTDLLCDSLGLCGAGALVVWTYAESRTQVPQLPHRPKVALSKQGLPSLTGVVTDSSNSYP